MPEAQQESGRRGEQLPECLKLQAPQPSRSCQQVPRKACAAILPGEDEGEDSEESVSFSNTSVAPDGRFATGPGEYGSSYGSSEGSEEQDNDYTVEDQSEQDPKFYISLLDVLTWHVLLTLIIKITASVPSAVASHNGKLLSSAASW